MKKIYLYLFGCLATLGILGSCDDKLFNEDSGYTYTPSAIARYIYTSANWVSFPDKPDTPVQMTVESLNTPWRLNIADDWIKATPAEGNGEASETNISMSADANPSTCYRISVFSLESATDTTEYNYSKQIVAEQRGTLETYLIVTTTVPMYFTATASSETFTVDTNAPEFSVRTNGESWLTISQSGKEVTVTVQANTTEEERVGYIYFDIKMQQYGENPTVETYQLEVRQAVPGYTLTEESLSFYNSAGSKKVTLYCDLDWTATTSDSWLSVSPEKGVAGTTDLTVSVVENGSIDSRSGIVNLHVDGNYLIQIPVTQMGLYADVQQEKLSFESVQSSLPVKFDTNLSFWNVLEKPRWISVSPDKGESGTQELTITAKENPNTTTREGRIIIGNKGLNLTDTLWVEQSGKSFGALETVLRFENTASSSKLDINTDGNWTVTTSNDWISVSPATGHGNGQTTVTVKANDSDDERTGLLTVTVGETTQYVNVVQNGRYFTINYGASSALPSTGGTIDLSIATNQTWTAAIKNGSSWLTLSATQGQGNAKLVISALDNPTMESRIDTVIFTPANKQGVKLAVKQAGRYLNVSTQTVSFFYKGGTSEPVTISTDGVFRVEKSNADWLAVTKNNNLLTLTAQANNGNTNRTATLSLYLTQLSGEQTEVKVTEIKVTQYIKGCQFVRDEYGEDVRLDISYKDGGLFVKSEYGTDKDLSNTPNDNGSFSREEYDEEQKLEQ